MTDIDTMSGRELREAVAIGAQWLHPYEVGDACRELPPFDTSLDAHFAPDGTVEDLIGMTEEGDFHMEHLSGYGWGVSSCLLKDGWEGWQYGSTPAEALCRAYLRAKGGQ